MMLSSWVMNPTWYRRAACPMKNSVIAMPIAIRTMCCFTLPRARRACERAAEALRSSLEEEFHLHAGELDDIVILERMRSGADLLAVHLGAVGPFDVSDEIALRAARQHRDLDA